MAVDRASTPWETSSRLAILVVAVVASMSLAQEVLKPLALAGLLAFILAPLVRFVERRLAHKLAVAVTVTLVLGTLASVGYIVTGQLINLADDLPRYQARIDRKIAQLMPAQQSALSRASEMARHIDELVGPQRARREVAEVKIVPETSYRERIVANVGPYLEVLGVGAIVLILVVSLLLRREDLSDRIIRLFGHRKIGLTTRTMDEAGRRTSRYLAAVAAVNAGYGLVVALGLWAIGVPQPVLWGALAGALRSIPYIGPAAGFGMPLLLSFIISDGWREPLLVAALFGALEAAVLFVLKPVLYGRTTGVSSVGLLVAAMFWSWLWGPIGLLLSTPLTLSLAVVGRYVPGLGFFTTLLGEEPALGESLRLYRRLLADDRVGARAIFDAALRDRPREAVFDDLLVATLAKTEFDHAAGEINDDDRRRVGRAVDDYLDQLEWEATAAQAAGAGPPTEAGASHAAVLGIAEPDSFDALVLRMVALLLAERGAVLQIVPAAGPASALAASMAGRAACGVVLSALRPADLPAVTDTARTLRARLPGLAVVVGEWQGDRTADALPTLAGVPVDVVTAVGQARDRVLMTALPTGSIVRMLRQALLAGERLGFERLHALALRSWSIDKFCRELAEPLIDALAADRAHGRITAEQEAQALRHLGERLALEVNAVRQAGADARRALVAWPGAEAHDVRAMLLTLSLRARGWDVLDLGSSVEAALIPAAVTAFRPRLVVLSAGQREAAAALAPTVRAIIGATPHAPAVVVAGAGYAEAPDMAAGAAAVLPPGIDARLDAIERFCETRDD